MSSLTSSILIGLVFAGSIHADLCPTQSLVKLSSSINITGCTADTGLSMSTISSLTPDQITDLCESSFCMAFLDEVASENLGDCTIPGLNVFVKSDILSQVKTLCRGNRSTGSMSMGSMSMGSMSMGSSFLDSGTNVGDDSGVSSLNSDDTIGRSPSTSSGRAETVTVGFATLVVATLIALL